MAIDTDPAHSPRAARESIRAGEHTTQTAGLARGYLQGNLVVLSPDDALEFATYCHRNPKPCPLLAIGDPGDPMLPSLGADIDIRTDVPRYNIYRYGKLTGQVENLTSLWREDFVTFVLGCSFSFEEALLREGIRVRHIDETRTVPMYRTSIVTAPAGRFGGPLVVSMRMMPPESALRAIRITARFTAAHGAPVHFGDPAAIGISDLAAPDWGDPPTIVAGEIPVFWACGVTPQAAILNARLEIAITHCPGSMLITDRRADAFEPD